VSCLFRRLACILRAMTKKVINFFLGKKESAPPPAEKILATPIALYVGINDRFSESEVEGRGRDQTN